MTEEVKTCDKPDCPHNEEVKGLGVSDILLVIQFLKNNPEVIEAVKDIIQLVKSLFAPKVIGCGPDCEKK